MKVIKKILHQELLLIILPMRLSTDSSETRLLNEFILVDFCGAIHGKCVKCLNSWWNCLEMNQEFKKIGSQHDLQTYPISAYP